MAFLGWLLFLSSLFLLIVFFFVWQQIKYPLVLCSSNFLAFFSERFWYCRLSPNLKFLHYGDCQEGQAPPLENLPNKCEYVLRGRVIELSLLLYCPCAALRVSIKKTKFLGVQSFLRDWRCRTQCLKDSWHWRLIQNPKLQLYVNTYIGRYEVGYCINYFVHLSCIVKWSRARKIVGQSRKCLTFF